MRRDGQTAYYVIEALLAVNPRRPEWSEVDLAHMLFTGRGFEWSRGPEADRFRRLLAPQSASSALWQRYGIHGYEKAEDARAMFDAAVKELPKREFRLVCRARSQVSRVVAT